MRVLWITNIPLPEYGRLLGIKINPFGGWLDNLSKEISNSNEIKLSVAFPQKHNLKTFQVDSEKVTFFPFKMTDNNHLFKNEFKKILDIVTPDIVHIFGTEYLHSKFVIEVLKEKNIKFVINIQGLVSIISQHYNSNLPFEIVKRFTFRDLVKRDNLIMQQKKMRIKGKDEIEMFNLSKYVIGRTEWDKICVKQINSDLHYFHCNEVLRSEFYKHKWSLKFEHFERNSIFVSQAGYPLKGLHNVIEAMNILRVSIPDIKLYIAGHDITAPGRIFSSLKQSSYGRYIHDLIKHYNLESRVQFLGVLDESEMCNRYLRSHIFISASSIENESNSLSEARLLGVPSISSYVGGTITRVEHMVDGIQYPHDAPYLLANYISNILNDDNLAESISNKSRSRSTETFHVRSNVRRLIEIYKFISDN